MGHKFNWKPARFESFASQIRREFLANILRILIVFSKCAQLFGKLITCARHLNHFYLFLFFAAPAPAAIDERQCDPFAPDQGIIDIPPTHRLQLYSARVQAVLRLARLYGECFSPLRQPVLGSNNIYNPETANPDF